MNIKYVKEIIIDCGKSYYNKILIVIGFVGIEL